MSKHIVAFVTSDRNQGKITHDDQILADVLTGRGHQIVPAIWSDTRVDWTPFDAVVIRSTWDYHLRHDEFRGWLARCADLPVWNPVDLVSGNMHKAYLLEFADRGLSVVPTRLLYRGETCDLEKLRAESGWSELVVKPAISATAHKTWRTTGVDESEAQQTVAAMLNESDVLIQPLVKQIVEDGEYSYLYFAGTFSHAVLKRAVAGDFRVQSDFGGSVERVFPGDDLLAQAQVFADAIPGDWLYARIDVVNVDGQLVLMELELIEPHLFFAQSTDAATLFSDALLAKT